MSEPNNPADEVTVAFTVGTLHDHRVLIHFALPNQPGKFVDHLKLEPEKALELAEALVEAARDAARGRLIIAGGHQSPERGN